TSWVAGTGSSLARPGSACSGVGSVNFFPRKNMPPTVTRSLSATVSIMQPVGVSPAHPTDRRDSKGMGQGKWWRRPLLWAALVTAVWVLVGGPLGSYQGRLGEVQDNDTSSFLPATAEATRVDELQRSFNRADVVPAVVVVEREGGLTEADLAWLTGATQRLGGLEGVTGLAGPPEVSPDRAAAQAVVLV